MRLGVLDVGSNTVHLLVVDAHPGARPLPAYSHKAELRLAELLDDGRRDPRRRRASGWSPRSPRRWRSPRTRASRTSCRSPPPRCARRPTPSTCSPGSPRRPASTCRCCPGEDEARLTFLAARRWFGWSAGRLLVLDIGGGSLEIAYGMDEEPDAAVSLPLGAGRLTSGWLPGDPPDARGRARAAPARAGRDRPHGRRVQPVRRARPRGGAPPRRSGSSPGSPARPAPPRACTSQRRSAARRWRSWVPRLGAYDRRRSAPELPGVSEGRARQLLAGALVAEAAMDLFGVARAGGLPVGAARGRHPAPPGPDDERPGLTTARPVPAPRGRRTHRVSIAQAAPCDAPFGRPAAAPVPRGSP